MGRILVIDDDRAFRLSTGALLEEGGHDVRGVSDAQGASRALRQERFDLVLLDLRMPGLSGIELAEALRTQGAAVPILMISGFGTVESAVKAIHSGVDDFLTKPVEPEVLLSRVDSLLERRPDPEALDAPLAGMVGRSAAISKVFSELRQVAGSDATVLITGETGTGKELAARAVHELSPRKGRPFVAVNCAALAEGIMESELFGHVRGAFTGAIGDRRGLIRGADGGTLFLDEVGDISPGTQQRLLRVLQEREVVPLGSSQPVHVDLRLVAATHRDLAEEVRHGRFRDDLFFRLNVFRVAMPPLRERKGDIPLLVESALRSTEGSRTLSPLAMRTLLGYDWPGNVRQLLSALESARIRAEGGMIEAQHLPDEVRMKTSEDQPEDRYRMDVEADTERAEILEALRQSGGVRVRAAAMLGMSRTTLWRKIRDYGIENVNP